MNFDFSLQRFWAIMVKEFIQMKRDKFTFGMMIGVPLLQIILFGYAINSDPKHLPTAIVSTDNSIFTRTFIADLENSSYFKVLEGNKSREEADWLLRTGQVQFVLYIPQNFSRNLVRGEHPELLVEADATDPAATSFSLGVFQNINEAISHQFNSSLDYLNIQQTPINLVIQSKYNPERITQYNIVPGLLGVVLTMTMVIITALAITRERERGTMESLLAMPVQPMEVILGKLAPYIFVGYIQVIVILIASSFLFAIPIDGSLLLLFICCFPFIIANLVVGLTFSTVARNQLQAMQASIFFFLPSILLSGFMFPFHGMPQWAQVLGNILPLTHFLVIVRGIMLKGNGLIEILPGIGAIFLFFFAALIIAIKRYRQTLD